MTTEYVTDSVCVNVEGRIATVELNRPEALNALDKDMLKGLLTCLKDINNSDDIDIMVLRGRGRAFSAGGDIKLMLSGMNESDFYPIMECINELVITLYGMSKVTICSIHGAAAGLGLSLALATDYIIADRDSKLAMNFINIGLIPDGGGHFFLENRLGEAKAKHVIWEGKTMNADEALSIGLIEKVADGNMDEILEAQLSIWLNKPIQAMIKTKKILAEKNRPDLLKLLELEKHAQYKMRQTKDHQEGIKAFLEKRKPVFKGK